MRQFFSRPMAYGPMITTPSPLPSAEVGLPYSTRFNGVNGTPAYTFVLTSGSLAPGLTFVNGLISGTPTATQVSVLGVKIVDAAGISSNIYTFSFTVISAVSITTTSLPNGTQNVSYLVALAGAGGATPYTWSIISGALQAGLSLNASTGVISGIPTASGTTTPTFSVTDALGGTANKAIGITINAAGATVNPLGVLFPAQGGQYSFEGLPQFQDMFRGGRYINNFTASLASSGVLTVSALQIPTSNNIPLGSSLLSLTGHTSFTYLMKQLSGTANGIGTYQTSQIGLTVASQTMNTVAYPILTDAAGWPTTDFGFLLWEGSRTFSWQTGNFACGFTSKNGGLETITAISGCTIVDTGTSGGIHTFDLTFTSGAVQFRVTGTAGGVTNIFCRLPAYRAGGYVGTGLGITQFTTEAISEYSNYGHLRDIDPANGWNNFGEVLSFEAIIASGIGTTAVLTKPFPYTTGTYDVMFLTAFGDQVLNMRTLTLTNGSTAVSWIGTLTTSSYAIVFPNSSQTRKTPANTKCYIGNGFGEGFPKEWHLDLCSACSNNPYLCVPVNDDGTWRSSFATMITSNYPALKSKYEIQNEMWGGKGQWVFKTLWTFKALANTVFYAQTHHAFAATMRTAYGANFDSNCEIWMCWQQGGNGQDFFYNVFAYYDTQTWVPSADIKVMAVAPYYNTTSLTGFTASINASGVLTVTGFPSGNDRPLAVNAVVTGTGVPANSAVTSQLTGRFGSIGTYQLSTTGTVVASEAMNASLPTASSIAQIQAHLTPLAANNANLTGMENFFSLAASRNLKCGTYEGGFQVNAESSTITNTGAAQLDAGFTAVENGHLQGVFNSGVYSYSATEAGVCATLGNTSPINELSIAFPPTNANSPKRAAYLNYTTPFTPSKNAGLIIQGYSWADNTDTTILGHLALGSFVVQPYYHTAGYIPYVFNITTAGTYNLDVTWVNVSGTPHTGIQVDSTIITASGIVVANGVVRVASAVVLSKGSHLILLGQSGAQGTSAQNQISQIQLN
jgi:hypothetical protein